MILSRAEPVHRVLGAKVEWVEWVVSRPLEGPSAHTSVIAEGTEVTGGLSEFIASLSEESLHIIMGQARPGAASLGAPHEVR